MINPNEFAVASGGDSPFPGSCQAGAVLANL